MGPGDVIDPIRALGACRAAQRIVAPRCASLACGHAAEWTGNLFLHAAERAHGPVAILSFPRLCSSCTVVHMREHIAGQHFLALVADFARAARLPPPDAASLHAEFAPI
jgi:hypothetical protein